MPAAERRLGRSGVQVTPLALGTGMLCTPVPGEPPPGEPAPGDEAAETVRAAWEAGIRYFDTAPFYGLGGAEQRLGAVLADYPREDFVLSTKVGRLLDGSAHWRWDFSATGVQRSLGSSLDRLGLDRVDVVLLHDPDEHWREAAEQAYPVLHDLRAQGVVRGIGVGMNDDDMLERFVRECDLDCVLVAGRYSLLDRRAENGLLGACLERGVAVVAAGVLNSGVLADPDAPDATYDYRPAGEAIRQRARDVAAKAQAHGVPLLAAALQFPARHPAVASVLAGCRTVAEVQAAVRHFTHVVPEDLWSDLPG